MDRRLNNGTYVYCLVAAARRPALARIPRGLPGAGRPRLLEAPTARAGAARTPLKHYLIVAVVPLDRYGQEAIDSHLSDLDWVSRAAVAHESVVEAFITAPAVLPMKLFTIFTSDERALDHIRADAGRIASAVRRLAYHHEWGVRIMLDRTTRPRTADRAASGGVESGRSFLSRKKAHRDEAAELARHAHETVSAVYDRLAGRSSRARRRAGSDLPIQGGPLLLDAAFLVATSRTARFRASVAREAKAIARHGYRLTLTGPWPPYTFIQE